MTTTWIVRLLAFGSRVEGDVYEAASGPSLVAAVVGVPVGLYESPGGLGHQPAHLVKARGGPAPATIIGTVLDAASLREGVYGLVRISSTSAPWLAPCLEALERRRELQTSIGLSLQFTRSLAEVAGREVITFKRVYSVDIVDTPLAGGRFIARTHAATGRLQDAQLST
jgi:hypothetical protein